MTSQILRPPLLNLAAKRAFSLRSKAGRQLRQRCEGPRIFPSSQTARMPETSHSFIGAEMRSILQRISRALLDDSERIELEFFRANADRTQQRPNSWQRLLSPDNALVGFSYRCACGSAYTILDARKWLTGIRCRCGHVANVLDACNIPKSALRETWPSYFVDLPIAETRIGPKPRSPFMNTWPDDGGEVEWTGSPQRGI